MKLSIGGHKYTIKERGEVLTENGKVLLGLHDARTCTIELDSGMNASRKEETLLHEIIHVMLTNGGFQDHSESMIDTIANGMLQLGVGSFVWKKAQKA